MVERIGHIFFVLGSRYGAKGFFLDGHQRHIALRRHQPAKCNVPDRMYFGIDKDHVIELLRQFLCVSKVVNGFANGPMLRREYHFALHQTASGKFRIGQGLFDSDPVTVIQSLKDCLLLGCFQIF